MRIQTLAIVRLVSGTVLRPTPRQLSVRQHLGWRRDADGWGVCAATVEFKAGEIVEILDPPKDILAQVRILEESDGQEPEPPAPEVSPEPEPEPEPAPPKSSKKKG